MEPIIKLCSRCKRVPRRDKDRYCAECRKDYKRAWKKTSAKAPAQRIKDNARDYARAYKRLGKLPQRPCEVCGSEMSEIHHDDYSKPLEVRWLCRFHHLEHHKACAAIAREYGSN